MLRKILCLLFLLLILPVQAGELDEIIMKNHGKIFLYLYTKDCSYCVKFNPIYEKLVKKYGQKCIFFKIDANTERGHYLMYETRTGYVPNVIFIDTSKQTMGRVDPVCLIDEACINNTMNKFINQ